MAMREWLYGKNPVFETLRAGRRHFFQLVIAENTQEKGRLEQILALSRSHKLPIKRVSRVYLDQIGQNHQGVALEASGYPYSSLVEILGQAEARQEEPFLLVLDALQDPQNLGTLMRTAEAVGVHGVLLPLRQTATVTPAVVSASSGATEHLWISQTNLAQAIRTLKENNLWVVGLEGSQDAQRVDAVRLDGPLGLVVGSEGQGMRPLVKSLCDQIVSLPMRGNVGSLNAAVAGSVALYLAWQARRYADPTASSP